MSCRQEGDYGRALYDMRSWSSHPGQLALQAHCRRQARRQHHGRRSDGWTSWRKVDTSHRWQSPPVPFHKLQSPSYSQPSHSTASTGKAHRPHQASSWPGAPQLSGGLSPRRATMARYPPWPRSEPRGGLCCRKQHPQWGPSGLQRAPAASPRLSAAPGPRRRLHEHVCQSPLCFCAPSLPVKSQSGMVQACLQLRCNQALSEQSSRMTLACALGLAQRHHNLGMQPADTVNFCCCCPLWCLQHDKHSTDALRTGPAHSPGHQRGP